MQLRDHVAERGDIELGTGGDGFERAGGVGDLAEQLDLLVFLQVDDFDERRLRGTRISHG